MKLLPLLLLLSVVAFSHGHKVSFKEALAALNATEILAQAEKNLDKRLKEEDLEMRGTPRKGRKVTEE